MESDNVPRYGMQDEDVSHTHKLSPLIIPSLIIFVPSSYPTIMFQSPSYPEPPTSSSLAYARSELDVHRQSLQDIATKIQAAEDTLARIVRDSRATIHEFETQRNELEHKVALALSYISPIRRLPLELLRLVFLIYFEECPCCAWILSAVSRSWRAMVLSMPILWSKVRTTPIPTPYPSMTQ